MGLTRNISDDNTLAYLFNKADEDVKSLRSELIDLIYPVGSIYMSVNNASPQAFLGGTWERITGKFLLAATDGGSSGASQAAGRTGGGETHVHSTGNHTLTAAEIPSHSHTVTNPGHPYYRANAEFYIGVGSSGSGYPWAWFNTSNGNTGGGGAHNHGNTGSGSNIPPYLSVYVWKRTA